jgi:hypothetical protein
LGSVANEGDELAGDIVDGLQELGLARVPLGHPVHERLDVHHRSCAPRLVIRNARKDVQVAADWQPAQWPEQ